MATITDRLKAFWSPNGKPSEPTEVKSGVSFTNVTHPSGLWFGTQLPEDIDPITRQKALLLCVYIYSAVRYRAQKISEPPMIVAEKTEDGLEPIDHPLQELLDYPSEDYDAGETLEITSAHMDLTGESLWLRSTNAAGRTLAVHPISGDEFRVEPADGLIYGRYRIHRNVIPGLDRTLGPEDVVHFRYPHPQWRGKALAPLDAALDWANLGREVENQVRRILKNVLLPPAILEYPENWNPDDEQREKNREEFRRRWQGTANVGDPVMVGGGVDVELAEQDLNNIVPQTLFDRVEANVALAFGVRPEILGFTVGLENSPWSHLPEARRITYEDAIEPTWRRMGKTLTRTLFTREEKLRGLRVTFDTSRIRALQDDEEQKSRIANQNARFWTVAEARMATGQQPFGDERDEMTVEELAGATRGLGAFQEAFDQMSAVVTMQSKAASKDLSDPHARTLYWFEFDAEVKAAERTWEREVSRLLRDQSSEVRRLFNAHVQSAEEGIDPDSVSTFLEAVDDWVDTEGKEALRRGLEPLVQSTAERSVRRLTARFGLDFDAMIPGLERFSEREAAFLAEKMGETTGKAVADTMDRVLQDRLPFRDVRSRLEDLPAFDRERAQLVARTETTRATNGAQRAGMADHEQRTGERVEKTWISSRDDRVRDEHEIQDDGEWYGVNEEFPVVGLQNPGDPNCRCTLGYRIVRG